MIKGIRSHALLGTAAIVLAGSAGVAGAATAPTSLDPTTEANLGTALHEEAFDWTSTTLYAEQATRDGAAAAATVLTGVADTERTDHLTRLAALAGVVGTDQQNLQAGIDGETYEATTMYPQFAAQARADGCYTVANRFDRIAAEEWMHAQKYKAALTALNSGRTAFPRPGSLNLATVLPSQAACPGTQTQVNLGTAMKGESLATAKYELFAVAARSGGNARLGELFEGTAKVEFREHMSNEAILSGLVQSTNANLAAAAERASAQVSQYGGYAAAADTAGDTAVAAAFTDIAHAEAAQAAALTGAATR